jgi:peptide deformylase
VLIVDDEKFLRQVSRDLDFQNPERDPKELATLLGEQLLETGGLGLSAIQIGIPIKAFAIRTVPYVKVLFNARIVYQSDVTEVREEGCLSFPNLIMKIKRPFEVRVRYQDPDGVTHTEKWGGLTARCVQHEVDHGEGVLFWTRANRFHRDQAFRRRKNMIRHIKKLEL